MSGVEKKLSRKLQKMGYALRKSRVKKTNIYDYGGYMIVDPWFNTIVCGERFEMSLDDVKNFITGP